MRPEFGPCKRRSVGLNQSLGITHSALKAFRLATRTFFVLGGIHGLPSCQRATGRASDASATGRSALLILRGDQSAVLCKGAGKQHRSLFPELSERRSAQLKRTAIRFCSTQSLLVVASLKRTTAHNTCSTTCELQHIQRSIALPQPSSFDKTGRASVSIWHCLQKRDQAIVTH